MDEVNLHLEPQDVTLIDGKWKMLKSGIEKLKALIDDDPEIRETETRTACPHCGSFGGRRTTIYDIDGVQEEDCCTECIEKILGG